MSQGIVASEPMPGVGQVLFDVPPRNILGPAHFTRLETTLTTMRERGTRVVVFGSAIEGSFFGHGSLEGIIDFFEGKSGGEDPGAQARVYREVERGPMVSIAAIDGQCWGGGAEFAWSCDLRVASARASIAQPEVNIGLTPGWGGASKLARLFGESAALRLVLDGRPVDGEEAFRLGLVHRVVEAGRALSNALDWASWLASRPPEALTACKSLVRGSREIPLKEALGRELQTFAGLASTPDTMARIKEAQRRYDSGEDSMAAFGIARR